MIERIYDLPRARVGTVYYRVECRPDPEWGAFEGTHYWNGERWCSSKTFAFRCPDLADAACRYGACLVSEPKLFGRLRIRKVTSWRALSPDEIEARQEFERECARCQQPAPAEAS